MNRATKVKRGTCPRCANTYTAENPATIDHIVPKWFTRRIGMLGIKKISHPETEIICLECNVKKGGKIEWENPKVKDFFHIFIEELNKKL